MLENGKQTSGFSCHINSRHSGFCKTLKRGSTSCGVRAENSARSDLFSKRGESFKFGVHEHLFAEERHKQSQTTDNYGIVDN